MSAAEVGKLYTKQILNYEVLLFNFPQNLQFQG